MPAQGIMKRFAEDNAALMVEAHRLLAENALLRQELGEAPAEESEEEPAWPAGAAQPQQQPPPPASGAPPLRIREHLLPSWSTGSIH